jgi:hypothetical protein
MVIRRIVERIVDGELGYDDISRDLYCGYQKIRDALAIQAYLKRVGHNDSKNIIQGYVDDVLKEIRSIESISVEPRILVINRIIEMIYNSELDRMDIPADLYKKCGRIRAAIANREYRKAMDAVRKYAEDKEDTITIDFGFKVDPDIDTDTVNVHVHIKNKED